MEMEDHVTVRPVFLLSMNRHKSSCAHMWPKEKHNPTSRRIYNTNQELPDTQRRSAVTFSISIETIFFPHRAHKLTVEILSSILLDKSGCR